MQLDKRLYKWVQDSANSNIYADACRIHNTID